MIKKITALAFMIFSNFVYAESNESFLLANVLKNFGEKDTITFNVPLKYLKDKKDYTSSLVIPDIINPVVNIYDTYYEVKIQTNEAFRVIYSDKEKDNSILYDIAFGNVYKINMKNEVLLNEENYLKYKKIISDKILNLGFTEYSSFQKLLDGNIFLEEMNGTTIFRDVNVSSFIKDDIVISITGYDTLNLTIVNKNHKKIMEDIEKKLEQNYFSSQGKKMESVINNTF